MTPPLSSARVPFVGAAFAIALFLSAFTIAHQSVIGSPVIPCNGGGLAVYCWTADLLGNGLAWLLWHGLVSLVAGWMFVELAKAPRDA